MMNNALRRGATTSRVVKIDHVQSRFSHVPSPKRSGRARYSPGGVVRVATMDDGTGSLDLVDRARYPLPDLAGPTSRSVVAQARAQLAATGAAELPGFI